MPLGFVNKTTILHLWQTCSYAVRVLMLDLPLAATKISLFCTLCACTFIMVVWHNELLGPWVSVSMRISDALQSQQ